MRLPHFDHLTRTLSWRPSVGSDQGPLMVLAVIVGAIAGFGAIAFRWLIAKATLLFTGTPDYSGTTGHPAHPWFPWLGAYFIVLAPVIGGLLYGPLVHRFAREARGHGVPEVMYAISKRGGRIPARVALIKALASALTIGSGGSVGREGPIVQIGSAMGSALGRFVKLSESQVRMLVACGAAGGIAATFNAPIAGVFFALELLLASFAVRSFAAVVLASVTASVIGRTFLGDDPFLSLPKFTVHHATDYLLYIVLGVLAAGVALLFTKVLYGMEDLWDRIWRGPEWARPAVGGVVLGLVLLVLPQMYGVGYPILQNGVGGKYAVGFLIILLLGKIFATSLTIGIGGSGGVFAPSLFLGAMLGAAFGQILDVIAPGLGVTPGAFALVGMGAVFAGAARAPITAVIILFELTGEYSIILPLMLAVVVATGVAGRLSKDTIYTLKLRRRGVDLRARPRTAPLGDVRVSALMIHAPMALRTRLSASHAARTLLDAGRASLPVISDHDEYIGVVTATAAASALADDDDADEVTVKQLVEWRPYLDPDATVESVLDEMLGDDATDGLPVLSPDGHLVGWLGHDAVLREVTRASRREIAEA